MKIKYTYIERIELTGPYSASDAAFDYCARYGYHVTRSGPKRISAMKVDTSKYVIIAERIQTSNVAASGAQQPASDDIPHSDAE